MHRERLSPRKAANASHEAGNRATPPLRMDPARTAFSRATASRPPSSSRCAGADQRHDRNVRPIMEARSFISPGALMPASTTATRWRSGRSG
jgi:hypothetical protein